MPVAIVAKDWEESQHPRDEQGRFGFGEGGKLDKSEKAALSNYTAGHAVMINHELIAGKPLKGMMLDEAKALDSAIGKSTLMEDVTIYRGMSFLAQKWSKPASDYSPAKTYTPGKPSNFTSNDPLKDSVGKIISSANFVSTSNSEESARYFATREPLKDFASGAKTQPVYDKYLMKIEVPKGTKMLDVNAHNPSAMGGLTAHEREYLLGRDAKFYISGMEKGADGVTVVTAKVIK